jgi:hypothetical protein
MANPHEKSHKELVAQYDEEEREAKEVLRQIWEKRQHEVKAHQEAEEKRKAKEAEEKCKAEEAEHQQEAKCAHKAKEPNWNVRPRWIG